MVVPFILETICFTVWGTFENMTDPLVSADSLKLFFLEDAVLPASEFRQPIPRGR